MKVLYVFCFLLSAVVFANGNEHTVNINNIAYRKSEPKIIDGKPAKGGPTGYLLVNTTISNNNDNKTSFLPHEDVSVKIHRLEGKRWVEVERYFYEIITTSGDGDVVTINPHEEQKFRVEVSEMYNGFHVGMEYRLTITIKGQSSSAKFKK